MEALYFVPMLMWEHQRRRRQQLRLLRRQVRDAGNPFEMREEDFRLLFRISRRLAMDIVTELTPRLSRRRSSGLPVHAQVLSVIRFFATGSYQRCVGQDMMISMGQPSVSRNIAAVSNGVIDVFAHRYIRFPSTFEERQSIKNRFMEMRGFPGVVGCVDCTHIKIVKPTVREEMYYNNHKRCHSLNVQAICDHDLRVLAINARYPGSVHDQFIWNASLAKEAMQRWYDEGIMNTWLLGDSGYALQPFLLTPIRDADPETPEGRYTHCHCQTRNCVERLFGVLKMTWRCLHHDRVLHYNPESAAKIVLSCSVLHNMMLAYSVDMPQEEAIPNLEYIERGADGERNAAAEDVRMSVVRQFFT